MVCVPSDNTAVGVNVQLPFVSAVVEPKTVAPSFTVTTEFASAVPVIAGLETALIWVV